MMIQCWSSHCFAGRLYWPVEKVAPACSSIISPQLASTSADCKSPPAATEIVAPGAGVSASVVLRYTQGNSAGPSKLPQLVDDTAMLKPCVAELPAASVTLAVKEYSPVWAV